jgi:hypothetical protein
MLAMGSMKLVLNPILIRKLRAAMLFVWVISASLGNIAHACKYSVRDVAFVDLTQESYAFLTIGSGSDLDALKGRIQPVATAVFLDSNIRTGWLASEDVENHPGFQSHQSYSTHAGAFLYRDGLGPLKLMDSDEIKDADTNRMWSRMERAIQSPIRHKAVEHLLSAYAVILVVEGKDAKENDRVWRAAQTAADALAKMIPDMPKPVDIPPQVLVVPHQKIESEQAMLWSLGMKHQQPEKPQAAVLIGRGRRLGPTLQSDEITASKLQQILAVAGQDCECDLDRSWMQGPMIPVRWGPQRQQTAYNNLGFDPDNPLVKAEISRILARGKNPIRVNDSDSIAGELDMLLLGYSEEVLAFDESSIESTPTLAEPEESETFGSVASEDSKSEAVGEDPDKTLAEVKGNSKISNIEDHAPPVSATKQSPTSVRKILVMLAGFCVIAMIGGMAVLIIGRTRR